MKRVVTFSGQMPNHDDGSTVDSASQAARIIAALETKKLAAEVGHTSGAAGFADLLAQLLPDYVYVLERQPSPGRDGQYQTLFDEHPGRHR